MVDSTALIADFRLRTVPMQGLIERVRAGKILLVVPEVVVREVVARYGREAQEASADVKKAVRKVRRLGIDEAIAQLDWAAERDTYETWLRHHLSNLGAVIPEPEDTPHLDLVDRALARRAPFSDDGKRGYRDALIWETTLAFARTSSVVLLSANSKDFAESPDEVSLVAPDLRADLFRIGEPDDGVLVCRDPAAVVEHLFLKDEKLLAELRAPGGVSVTALVDMLDPVLRIEPHTNLGLPREARIFGVTNVRALEVEEGEDPDVEIFNALHSDSDLAYVQVGFPIFGDVEFSVPEDAIDERDGRQPTYEVDTKAPPFEGMRIASAHRELMVRGIASFDTTTRQFSGFTPAQVSALAVRPTPSDAHLLGLQPGDAVEHTTFGRGQVVTVEGEGSKAESEVEFEQVGRRRLLLAYAPLRRAEAR